jgi:hypothetical protein
VSGRLLSGGRAKGEINGTVECLLPPNFRSGPVKHYHDSWSAISEPDGSASRYCYDDTKPTSSTAGIYLTDIVMMQTTCKTVYTAIKAGSFSTPVPPSRSEFTTPGWDCTIPGPTGLPRYSCKKGSASFSFTKFD